MSHENCPYRSSDSFRPTASTATAPASKHTQPSRKKSRFETFESSSKTIPNNNLSLPLRQSRLPRAYVQYHRSVPLRTATRKMSPVTQTINMANPPPMSHEETAPTPSAPLATCRMVEEEPDLVVMYDDIERLVCHEDMPQLLVLAVKVKQLHQTLTLGPAPTPVEASQMDPREVMAVVDRIQQQHSSRQKPTVHRGTFPLTDSILEESLLILHMEVERCEQYMLCQRQEQEAAFHHLLSSEDKTAASPRRRNSASDDATTATTSNSIAVKYAKWQTDILMEWMMQNKAHPFPTPAEIEALALRTCLNISQIVNWTTNVRKRNWKATVTMGKKPHHFLDFLFLAQDRDQRSSLEEANSETVAVVNTPVRRGRSKNSKAAAKSSRKKAVKESTLQEKPKVQEDAPASESLSPCRTPKGKSVAVTPSASTVMSPDVPHTMGDQPNSVNLQINQRDQEGPGASMSFRSTATRKTKGSFVSPCMSPAPRHEYHSKQQQHHRHHFAGSVDQTQQPPPPPYRVTQYHPHYPQRQMQAPPPTPFLPRPCGMSSDYYYYNPTESPVAPAASSATSPYHHNDMHARHVHAHGRRTHEGRLHSVSESFDNNSNDSAVVAPTDLLDPWGDEENDCAHASGNGGGPSALMDAFARYWFEKCQDQDDEEEDDTSVPPSRSSPKTVPTGSRRFGSLESSGPEQHPHDDLHHQQSFHHKASGHRAAAVATSHTQKFAVTKRQERQVEGAVANRNLSTSGRQSPPHHAVKDLKHNNHVVVGEKTSQDPKEPPKQSDAAVPVKRWENKSKTATIVSKNVRMKRQLCTSFDEEEEDDDDDDDWITTTATTTHDGLDVADFIRELGLEGSHE